MLSHATRLLQVLPATFANPALRRVESAFAAFNAAEYGTWIAILIYAYSVGGVAAAGVAGFIQLVPAAVFAPVASVLGDRFPRRQVLWLGYLAQAASMCATGAMMMRGVAFPVVLAFATVTAATVTLTRPVQAALLPDLTRTPSELVAANVTAGWIEGISIFLGPFITGAVLLVSGPGAVFLVMGAIMLAATWLAFGVSVPIGTSGPARDSDAPRGFISDLWQGVDIAVREPRPRLVVGLMAGHFLLEGSLDVLIVILAVHVLHAGNSMAGFMNAAFGLGGVAGALATAALVARPRMAVPLAAGTVAWGLALVTIGAAPNLALSILMIGLAGLGRPLVDVSGRTLLQRAVPPVVHSRVFGLVEGLSMGAQGAGMLAVPILIGTIGSRATFVAGGLFLPLMAAGSWTRLRRIDVEDDTALHRFGLLQATSLFAPLPRPTIESLARRLLPMSVPAGTVIIRQRDAGEYFYLLETGDVDVDVDGIRISTMAAGSFFGEIALLRNTTRTATVTAHTDVTLLALERDDFLEAVTGHPQSARAAQTVVGERLGDDPVMASTR